MNHLRKVAVWFFVPHLEQVGFWRIVGWWELRRIIFTALIFGLTFCALLVYLFALVLSKQYEPDALFMLPAITIFANIGYTTGWIIDGLVTKVSGKRRQKLTTALLGAGLILWLVPSVLWTLLGFYGFIVAAHTK